jgi:hypothetical protein
LLAGNRQEDLQVIPVQRSTPGPHDCRP